MNSYIFGSKEIQQADKLLQYYVANGESAVLQDNNNLQQIYEQARNMPQGYGWQKVMDHETGTLVSADEIMRKYWVSGNPEESKRITDSIVTSGGFSAGNINLNQINQLALDSVFLGWGELSLLQQNAVVNTICSIMAESITGKWIELSSKNKDKKNANKIKELENELLKHDIKELMYKLCYKGVLLGTMYISPKLKGDDDYLAEELLLSKAKIKKGDLEEFLIIEPTWSVPVEFNMNNPRAPHFYKPNAFITFGKKIHQSRMKRLMFIEPCNLLQPIYLFGGVPMIQIMLPYIMDFINTKKEIVKIISRYNISILQTDLNKLATAGATVSGGIDGRMASLNKGRNNQGTFAIGLDEQFTQIQINTSGLTDLLQQQAELMSIIHRFPISKFFGQAPRGLNATGEFDANNFNEVINITQETKIRPILHYIISILQLNLWGDIDEDIVFDFVPLGALNESTQSQLKTDAVNRAISLVQAGMSDPSDMMENIKEQPDLMNEFQNLNIDKEAIAQKKQESEQMQQQAEAHDINTISDLDFIEWQEK